MSSTVAERLRVISRMRLHSALRTAVACFIIGGTALYGPKIITTHIKFTAFSYLTAVLIVSDASLGDTFRGCWYAFCATAQVVPLAMLGRRFIDPTGGMPVYVAAAGVALAAFVVAIPECTHLTTKRIAFGQIVLVFADAVYSEGYGDHGYLHPMYVAASTALGALASVLAMVVPYPSLASHKVERLCKVYDESTSERMDLYLRAFNAADSHTKMELLSQAKPLSETASKILQSITNLQEGIQWETPWKLFSKQESVQPGDRLRTTELQMRGIEYSLSSSLSQPPQPLDQEQLSNFLQTLSLKIQHKIKQEFKEKTLQTTLPILNQECTSYFFLSCMDMFLNDSPQPKKTNPSPKTWPLDVGFAFKCSISLGLAMLFGLIFDRVNGCWAGLVIAISFVNGKQAVFTVANTRAQGTAMGSVYGVICCFLFHYEELRLLALLPWIIFTSFLRHSKMYGQTGGVSAAIGALLILGRKNYGAPNEFALARLTEVFIGLTAFILVEVFVETTRASTLVKKHLGLTLCFLHDCFKEITTCAVSYKYLELRNIVCEYRKYVEDAEMEPDFWFLPFRSSCYKKMGDSLSNICDIMYFVTKLLENGHVCNEFEEEVKREFELLRDHLRSLIGSEGAMGEKFQDLEVGKVQNQENQAHVVIKVEEDGCEDKERVRERMSMCLGAMRFCINFLIKEINEIEICKQELKRWDK